MKTVLACTSSVHFVLFTFFWITVLGTVGALTAPTYIPEVVYTNLRLGLYYALLCFVPIAVKVALRRVNWCTFALQTILLAFGFLMQAVYQMMEGDDLAHDVCLIASFVCVLYSLACTFMHAQYLCRLQKSVHKELCVRIFQIMKILY